MRHNFVYRVEQWYEQYGRDLPWRQTKDAYRIWLSEIILQQTRVEQGRDYYRRFVEAYPDVHALAVAPEGDVMRLWQGLGYYSRARNLHAAARMIDSTWGTFPSEYALIRSLPGVGDYTAAAIASFAFDLPYAVLDGNVYRVLSRYFGIDTPIDTTSGKREFAALSQDLLDRQRPALYNQAIMDFGALQCKPHSPLCGECPLAESCQALILGKTAKLPLKSKRVVVRDRFFTYVRVHSQDGRILVHKREGRDIWNGLYEFLLFESSQPLSADEVRAKCPGGVLTLVRNAYQHQLTHQRLHVDYYDWLVPAPVASLPGTWIPESALHEYGFPQLLVVLEGMRNGQ